ncbi:hypothetical protein Ahy_A04g018050 [Arachis hypogaea]|uniref:Ubiquitin-like protease family profile domain-containing protein n=1 Tax=Arachis hypogaea TaxID=3818 RepID=A0A445DCT0_ARAHY|nr:hypothetical protein Ahy_A04g018050 [Arachis hypogaea]
MMVVREQTPSEVLAIVPIQIFVPTSQTTTDTDFEPTPMLRIEGTRETTPEPPKQLQETTPMLPPAPTKISRDAIIQPWIDRFKPGGGVNAGDRKGKISRNCKYARTIDSLVQKLASSAAKGKDKSPQIQRETGGESSAKFETPGGINQIPDDMKQKCYIWGTRLKEDANGDTNEYEEICTLIGQGEYILMRMHLASLQAKSDIESQIVSAICLILNQKNEKRFQEQIYCLPPDIMSMALSDHPRGNSYPRKRKRNSGWKPTRGYVFSRLITYAGGKPLEKGETDKEIKASYVKISGQKTSYDCAIYVMKWLELIEPENIKKGKYEWDNWPQEEVDHHRVEYASRILFSEMNKQRDRAIRESSAIRLSKPSSVLLSPFCQINSTDIETG